MSCFPSAVIPVIRAPAGVIQFFYLTSKEDMLDGALEAA